MRLLYLILIVLTFPLLLISQNENSKLSSLEKSSLYKVQLVCGAASDIGCGSRSKPILKDLDVQDQIKSSFLNRTGTIIMVVWHETETPDHDLVKKVINSHGSMIYGGRIGEGKDILEGFDVAFWYSQNEVDLLSLEEGKRIASQLVTQLLSMDIVSFEDSKKMHTELGDFIGQDLVNLPDVKLLSTTEFYDRWEQEMIKIGSQYIESGMMPKLELCGPNTASKACCSDRQGTCCN